jgi:hypothetical protein
VVFENKLLELSFGSGLIATHNEKRKYHKGKISMTIEVIVKVQGKSIMIQVWINLTRK